MSAPGDQHLNFKGRADLEQRVRVDERREKAAMSKMHRGKQLPSFTAELYLLFLLGNPLTGSLREVFFRVKCFFSRKKEAKSRGK